ncbi:MAG: outer membrane beta-barrel protein [Bacteroidia bacterium]|nr:outer membrane beta-barrel protein [Bacteroidia bacterium]
MRRFFATVLAASMMLAGTSAFAQISVGAGYLGTFQKLSATNLDISKSVYMNGLYAGLENTMQFDANMGLSVGAYYVYSAASASSMFDTLELIEGFVKGRLDEHFINIPVNLMFGADFQEGLRGFFYAGPTVSCGISSKVKANVLDVLKFNASDNYKHNYFERFDLLFGAGVGMDINNAIRIKAGFDYGLFNRIGEGLSIKGKDGQERNAINEKASLNRSQLTVGVSYLF